MISEYLEVSKRKRDLRRQADAFGKLADQFESRIADYVRDTGGKDRTARKGKYVLQLEDVVKQVSWKDEFIRTNSPEAALAVSNNPDRPTTEKLKVL